MTLDDWMVREGWTNTELGRHLGVSHTTVLRWRTQTIEPTGEMLETLVRITRGAVSPVELAPRTAKHYRAAEEIAARYRERRGTVTPDPLQRLPRDAA